MLRAGIEYSEAGQEQRQGKRKGQGTYVDEVQIPKGTEAYTDWYLIAF
jgi:hypothetical protein